MILDGRETREITIGFTQDDNGRLIDWWVSGDTAAWAKAQIAATMLQLPPQKPARREG